MNVTQSVRKFIGVIGTIAENLADNGVGGYVDGYGSQWVRPAAVPLPPFTWTVASAGACTPTAYASGSQAVGDVRYVAASGNTPARYMLCTAQTGSNSGTAPTAFGTQTDGAVTWFVVPSFAGGLAFAPSSGDSPLVGANGSALFPVPANGMGQPTWADPSQIYTSAAVIVQASP